MGELQEHFPARVAFDGEIIPLDNIDRWWDKMGEEYEANSHSVKTTEEGEE